VKSFENALLDYGAKLPEIVLSISQLHFDQIAVLTGKVADLEKAQRQQVAQDKQAARLQTMPGLAR